MNQETNQVEMCLAKPSTRIQSPSNEGSRSTSKYIQKNNMKINFTTRSRIIKTQSENGIFPTTSNSQRGNSGKQATMPAKRARTPTSKGGVPTSKKRQKENGKD